MNKVPADEALRPLIAAIGIGDDPDMVRQLIKKSRQPNMLRYTPKDASKRFRDQESFRRWLSGGRQVYWLIGDDDDLAGIIWYGKKAFPLDIGLTGGRPTETFAIRIYDGYNGHGLAVPAMRQTLRLHTEAAVRRSEDPAGIWLETDVDNPAALKVYSRFGYQEVHRDDERVTMVLPAKDIPHAISGPKTA